MAVFYRIHFERSVDKALKYAGSTHPGIKGVIIALLDARNREDYEAVVKKIISKSIDIPEISRRYLIYLFSYGASSCHMG
jgi:hypothetical protein